MSVILLDWECRESFHALKWLARQDVSRDDYELIWVELYERVVPEVLSQVDTLITCGQKGLYHKHKGYNAGLLAAQGDLVTVCDSDAVFPPNFISSILKAFHKADGLFRSLVLMHHELRTNSTYPKDLDSLSDMSEFEWRDIVPNAGACMTVRRWDAIFAGGFDEHESLRGYFCGPYDLGWRLINSGGKESWLNEHEAILWHFAHPDPVGSGVDADNRRMFSPQAKEEMVTAHIDGHALTAVEAFAGGRILPLRENSDVFDLRMRSRIIGSKFEEAYSRDRSALDIRKLLAAGPGFRLLEILGETLGGMGGIISRLTKLLVDQRAFQAAKETYWHQIAPWDKNLSRRNGFALACENYRNSSYNVFVSEGMYYIIDREFPTEQLSGLSYTEMERHLSSGRWFCCRSFVDGEMFIIRQLHKTAAARYMAMSKYRYGNWKEIARILSLGLLRRWAGERGYSLAKRAYHAIKRVKSSVRYPVEIPILKIRKNLDILVIELPPRYIPMIPNGLGYLYNILRATGMNFQIVDSNIIFYHRYHFERKFKGNPRALNLKGVKEDPWDNTNAADWASPELVEAIWPEIASLLEKVVSANPEMVGLSVHGSNRAVAKRFMKELRQRLPSVLIIVGGYDCVHYDSAPFLFPDFDYMVIGEAEETVPLLLRELKTGARPKDLPGIISKWDSPARVWTGTPLPADIDKVGYPRYEWTDLTLYQDHEGKRFLMPISGSRGCNWSRCRFCGECFAFRRRDPVKAADEIEFLVSKGFSAFHFNESDVNGDPDNLYAICSEIIRRNLKVSLMGQLRINKRNTLDYMRHLARAGFKHLRFGVDGWAKRLLILQGKGYDMATVFDNIRNTFEAGIYITVNMVIGVPGETEGDIDEAIANMTECKQYIGAVESLNTLILIQGSEYYQHPEKYKIHFRKDVDVIRREHPYYVPPDLWYSEAPFIDQSVRLDRLNRICVMLHKNGVNIGGFASRVVESLNKNEVMI